MRAITMAITTTAMALSGCAHTPREYGPHDFGTVSRHKVEGGTVTIARDNGTGCEWFWTSGRHPGPVQPRLAAGVQRCDAEAGTRGFRTLSRNGVGRDSVSVLRDDDTGCDWIWVTGRKAGGLAPRLDARGMICQRQ